MIIEIKAVTNLSIADLPEMLLEPNNQWFGLPVRYQVIIAQLVSPWYIYNTAALGGQCVLRYDDNRVFSFTAESHVMTINSVQRQKSR